MVLVKTTVSCGVGQGSMLFNHRFLSFFNNEMVLFNMGETRPLFAYFRLFQHNDKPCTYFDYKWKKMVCPGQQDGERRRIL